ncbi:MAG TPA: hypothetical protein VE197_21770, partial [Mycobacterium sp.]|nr:hypothetical protein [Mycobacterium sp.]
MPQRGGWVRQVHQDQPANDCVDRFVQGEGANCGLLEVHCRQALFGGAGAGELDHLGCGVHTENRSCR